MGIGILVLGAIALQLLLGLGLLIAALAMTVAHGWRAAMEHRVDGRWSLARKLMTAGGVLLGPVFVEAAGIGGLLFVSISSPR